MESPLGPALANIFVGYYEEKLFSQTPKPPTYLRYVDDTFAIFDHEAEADEFSYQTQLPSSIPQIHLWKRERKMSTVSWWLRRKNRYGLWNQCIPETHFHRPVFTLGAL